VLQGDVGSGLDLVLETGEQVWQLHHTDAAVVAIWRSALLHSIHQCVLMAQFSVQLDGVSGLEKRVVTLQGHVVSVYCDLTNNKPSGLLGQLVLSRDTAISYGGHQLQLQTITDHWDMHGDDPKLVSEWSLELRSRRNHRIVADNQSQTTEAVTMTSEAVTTTPVKVVAAVSAESEKTEHDTAPHKQSGAPLKLNDACSPIGTETPFVPLVSTNPLPLTVTGARKFKKTPKETQKRCCIVS
jgi:hypothetical protein